MGTMNTTKKGDTTKSPTKDPMGLEKTPTSSKTPGITPTQSKTPGTAKPGDLAGGINSIMAAAEKKRKKIEEADSLVSSEYGDEEGYEDE